MPHLSAPSPAATDPTNRQRGITFVLLTLVGAAAFILSFSGLNGLARTAGYGPIAWLLPFTVDVGAIAALYAWRTGFAPAAAAMRACLALMAGSIGLNVAFHLIVTGVLLPGWWWTVVVAAVPPAVLGLVVHAFMQGGADRPTTIRATAVRVVDDVDGAGDDLRERPSKSITERPRDSHGRFVPATMDERMEQIRELASTNGHVS